MIRLRFVLAAFLIGFSGLIDFVHARQPNIVVIMADDLGYADLSCQGSRFNKTPHIDALSENGVRCENGYAASPVGAPTRAALLTGRYPQRFGLEFNPPRVPVADWGLPLSETTLASMLSNAGYATGAIGKWQLGLDAQRHPQARGFDEFFGFLDSSHFYQPGLTVPTRGSLPVVLPWPSGILRGTQPVDEPEYLTDAFTREAVNFIDKHSKQPFFLFASYNAPHTPLEAPKHYLDRVIGVTGGDHRRRVYAAMVTALDDGVGAIVAKLKETGTLQNTLIFFLSDNGGMPGYISAASNAPLYGAKTELLEGGIRIPFLVQWPDKIPAGKVYDPMVSVLDVVPTALAAAGLVEDPAGSLDGINLTAYLSGQNAEAPHQRLFWRYGINSVVRQGNYKLFQFSKDGFQLYNLSQDIGETHDISASEPEIASRLREQWKEWNSQLVEPAWGQSNATIPWW